MIEIRRQASAVCKILPQKSEVKKLLRSQAEVTLRKVDDSKVTTLIRQESTLNSVRLI